jgi:hypothetical protein
VSALEALRSCAAARRARCRSTLRPVLRASVCMAAMLLLTAPLFTFEAAARGGGGGHGGGGFGGHSGGFGGHGGLAAPGGGVGFVGRGGGMGFGGARSFAPARFGGTSMGVRSFGVSPFGRTSVGVRSFGVAPGGTSVGIRSFGIAPLGGGNIAGRPRGVAPVGGLNIAPRSFAGRSVAGRSFTSPRIGIATAQLRGAGGRFVTASPRILTVAGIGAANWGRGAFGSRAIANATWRSQFASARFHGRFFGSHWWPGWRRGLVIGWLGPLFWPYADYDLFDYVYWPYAYDDFWPYAYDDVYSGIYGPYAYYLPYSGASVGGGGVSSGRYSVSSGRLWATTANGSAPRVAEVCNNDTAQLIDWPMQRISEVLEPTDAQRPALDELQAASAKTIAMLRSGCPKDLPSIPTGRLAAMESRLQVMLAAVQTVRPALERLYLSLNDEQKARFNTIAPTDDLDAAGKDQRDLMKFCDEKASGVTDLPIERIAQAVQPTPEQQVALDQLKDASVKAAEGLKVDCPTYQTLTPTGRVEAMEKRLDATLGALKTVQPALTIFYDSLSDEQKARFNSLRSPSRPLG